MQRLFVLISCCAVMLVPGLAFAVDGPPSINQLLSASPSGDWSIRVFKWLLGSFASSPFGIGGPDSLLGSLFIVLNSCLFAAGVTWSVKNIVAGVVSTASQGEVLGKSMSTIWFPIRTVIGIGGMLPVFHGFTLQQALLVWMASVGIGTGNLMWTGAVNATAQMQSQLAIQSLDIDPRSTRQLTTAAIDIFMANVCVAAEQDLWQNMEETGLRSSLEQPSKKITTTSDKRVIAQYLRGSTPACGQVTLQPSPPRESSTALSYRVASVNYDAIAAATLQRYETALEQLDEGAPENWSS